MKIIVHWLILASSISIFLLIGCNQNIFKVYDDKYVPLVVNSDEDPELTFRPEYYTNADWLYENYLGSYGLPKMFKIEFTEELKKLANGFALLHAKNEDMSKVAQQMHNNVVLGLSMYATQLSEFKKDIEESSFYQDDYFDQKNITSAKNIQITNDSNYSNWFTNYKQDTSHLSTGHIAYIQKQKDLIQQYNLPYKLEYTSVKIIDPLALMTMKGGGGGVIGSIKGTIGNAGSSVFSWGKDRSGSSLKDEEKRKQVDQYNSIPGFNIGPHYHDLKKNYTSWDDFRTGDVFFLKDNYTSWAGLNLILGYYTHLAIAPGRVITFKHPTFTRIDGGTRSGDFPVDSTSQGHGMEETSVRQHISWNEVRTHYHEVKVARMSNLDYSEQEKIINFLLKFLQKPTKYFAPSRLQNEDEWYCSKLVWAAFHHTVKQEYIDHSGRDNLLKIGNYAHPDGGLFLNDQLSGTVWPDSVSSYSGNIHLVAPGHYLRAYPYVKYFDQTLYNGVSTIYRNPRTDPSIKKESY